MAAPFNSDSTNESNYEKKQREWQVLQNRLKALPKKDIVFVCGAGVSMAAVGGIATWQALLSKAVARIDRIATTEEKELARRALEKVNLSTATTGDFAAAWRIIGKMLWGKNDIFLEWLRIDIGEEFYFKNGNISQLHEKLVALVKGIKNSDGCTIKVITTNYDLLLEQALNSHAGKGYSNGVSWPINNEALSWWNNSSDDVFHLYGLATEPNSIKSIYNISELYKSNFYLDFCRNLMSGKLIIFIGCGNVLKEPIFKGLLDQWRNSTDSNLMSHWFQFVRDDDEVAHKNLNRVVYGNNHEELPHFLEKELASWLEIDLSRTKKFLEFSDRETTDGFNIGDEDVAQLKIDIYSEIGSDKLSGIGVFEEQQLADLETAFSGAYPSIVEFMERVQCGIYHALEKVVIKVRAMRRKPNSDEILGIKVCFINALARVAVFRSKKPETMNNFHNSIHKGEAMKFGTRSPQLALGLMFRDNPGVTLVDKAKPGERVTLCDRHAFHWETDVEVAAAETTRSGDLNHISIVLLTSLFNQFSLINDEYIDNLSRNPTLKPDINILINRVKGALQSVKQKNKNKPIMSIPEKTDVSMQTMGVLVKQLELGVLALHGDDCLFQISEGTISAWFGLLFDKLRGLES